MLIQMALNTKRTYLTFLQKIVGENTFCKKKPALRVFNHELKVLTIMGSIKYPYNIGDNLCFENVRRNSQNF